MALIDLCHTQLPPYVKVIEPRQNQLKVKMQFFKKIGLPGFFLFSSFQTWNFFYQQINVKKCPSSIRRWDSNPRPSALLPKPLDQGSWPQSKHAVTGTVTTLTEVWALAKMSIVKTRQTNRWHHLAAISRIGLGGGECSTYASLCANFHHQMATCLFV